MKKTKSNPATLISDLDLHLDEGTDGNPYCYCTLRLGNDQYTYEDSTYVISLKKVMLHLDLVGFEMLPGTKFGEHEIESTFIQTSETSSQKRVLSKFGMGAGATVSATHSTGPNASAGLGLGASYSNERSVESTRKSRSEQRFHRVLSRGDSYWEVADFDGETGQSIPLRVGTYLKNMQLCGLSCVEGANHMGITGTVMVRKRDVDVTRESYKILPVLSSNKEKVMKALTADTLAGGIKSDFSSVGYAVLSLVEIQDEDS